MTFADSQQIVTELSISEPDTLTHLSAAILFFALTNDNWMEAGIDLPPTYNPAEIWGIMENFQKNEIFRGKKVRYEPVEDDLINIMEITLMAQVGSGGMVRRKVAPAKSSRGRKKVQV